MTQTNTVTVNLTGPLLIWAGVWIILAFLFDNMSLLWVAAAPTLLWFVIVALLMLLGISIMLLAFMSGQRIKRTDRHGNVKYYQRGR